jgi:NADH dehydrogenase
MATEDTQAPQPGGEGLHVVTGAFGYSGKYIARRMLEAGRRVRTLTGSPGRANPFGGKVEVRPFNFDRPAGLVESLRGAAVLYNTYWVRFNTRDFTFAAAVENSRTLFAAAKQAGVRRVVHLSVTNPSEDSPLEYFRGKAQVERALTESGLSYAILRPALFFGVEDILVNNIAWMLRKFPVFFLFGRGRYRLGPETFTYRELVELIASAIGRKRLILPAPPLLGWLAGAVAGKLLGDVVITRDEIKGLTEDLLCTDSPPVGRTCLADWAGAHAADLGARYTAEIARRRNREESYGDL